MRIARSLSAAHVRKGFIFWCSEAQTKWENRGNMIRKLWTIVYLCFGRIRNFLSICSFLSSFSSQSSINGRRHHFRLVFADFGKRIYCQSIVIPTGCFRHVYSDARIYFSSRCSLTLFAAKALHGIM